MITLFNQNSRLWRVYHCKEFRSFRKYVICPRSIRHLMLAYRIRQLGMFYPIHPQTTVHTLNAMRARINAGETLYYALKKDVGLYAFLIGKNRPFVLVLPGGGYGDVCSLIEGFPVAQRLNELGYNAVIGQYSIGKEAHYPNPSDDVAEILRFVFAHADGWGIEKKGYAVCGFSAGGHLAACWGTQTLGYRNYALPKPAALWLAYPVITMGEETHKGSRKNLLGKEKDRVETQKRYSAELLVDKDYPDTFLWQCRKDNTVSYRNSEMMAAALQKHGCKYVLLPIDDDRHGLGLGTETPAEGWLEKAIALWQKAEGEER